MFLLEPTWHTDGRWTALLAHCPANTLPQLAINLANSPLAGLKCYCATPTGELPAGLPWPNTLHAAAPAAVPLSSPTTPRLLPFGATMPDGEILVYGVNSLSDATSLARRDACSLCGAWFTMPPQRSTPNPAQPALLELLSLIVLDADTAEMEKVFPKAPQLTVGLLRLVNSVGVGGHRRTESIRQAIALLGYRQLQRWLQLLMYAEQYGPGGGLPPLFIAAALRAKRMELWAQAHWIDGIAPDSAFMVGMLSLLDRLFGQPLESLLAPLPLAPELTAALLRREGSVGEALNWLSLAEAGEAAALADRTQSIVHDQQHWMQCEIEALGWAFELLGTAS